MADKKVKRYTFYAVCTDKGYWDDITARWSMFEYATLFDKDEANVVADTFRENGDRAEKRAKTVKVRVIIEGD